MYAQVEKPKENKNRAVANSVTQKKSNAKQGIGFVDNRPETIAQKKLQGVVNNSSQGKQIAQMQSMTNVNGMPMNHNAGIIQRVATVNVTNTTDNYDSGWIQAETLSTGVDSGPRAEAQAVANIAGGTWVGGHMVNDCLGGHGGFGNIVPITAAMNNRHHTIENAAQNIVGNGGTAYEVRYYMNILHRDDYTFTPSGDKVNNLADRFQQSYKWRTKEVQAGGTTSRPIAYQAPGAITTVNGQVLDMA
jgi:hypothetical protein